MIQLTDKREAQKTSRYRDLKIGDWYEDSNGNICIKTPISEDGDNCLWLNTIDYSFKSEEESEGAKVKPLEVELVVRYQERG